MPYPNQYVYSTWQERFWAKVDKNGSIPTHRPELGPCWVWMASTDKKGYGMFKFGKVMRRAHKFIYEQMIGLIPEGKQCDHLCRNHGCVNYERHIEPVTPKENTARGLNAPRVYCINGHLYSQENTYLNSRGKRYCRECHLERSAYWYRKRSEGKVGYRRESKRTAYTPAI